MNTPVYFDDALPAFAAFAHERLGADKLAASFFLRDVSGRLSLVVPENLTTADEREALSQAAIRVLGRYVDDGGFAITTAADLFDDRLISPPRLLSIGISDSIFAGTVKVLDRRMIGADWLKEPVAAAPFPPRIAFASIKGGVGRSTALCVLAADLAEEGRRVLAIDMDLEAPGLGNMLLPGPTLPRFGLLDYHVETGLGEVDDGFLADMIGSSWLGRGGGQVDVIPAIGRASADHPANVLGKIARAYLSGIGADGEERGFSDNMQSLLHRLTSLKRYDVVLIDARAGLHETTASAIVGLGADVLLFGVNQPQTFAGYDLLFAHLGVLPSKSIDDWRTRFRFVHAKASVDPSSHALFAEAVERIVTTRLGNSKDPLTADVDVQELADEFSVVWDESTDIDLSQVDDTRQSPILIFDDSRYNAFDPLRENGLLQRELYGATYGQFLDECKNLISNAEPSEATW